MEKCRHQIKKSYTTLKIFLICFVVYMITSYNR